MLYSVIFKGNYGNVYEGIRVECESTLQAAVNAAKISKYTTLVSVTEEKGGLLESGDKTIPNCYKGTSIPYVSLYERGNIKFSSLEFPFSLDEKSDNIEFDEERYILAIRNVLLRKNFSEKLPPNHVMVGESHLEIGVIDSYEGWDENINPFHILRFK